MEASLELSNNRTKALNCTINKGETVNISLQSTTQNRGDQQYWLPFRLYMKSVQGEIPNSWATTKNSNVTARLVDTDAPTIQSVTAPAGTYASGQHVPITVTFSEFVDLSNARVTINGEEYTAAELSMNDYGVTAMLWYPVQDADDTTVTVNDMTGVEDVFGNELDNSQYQGDSIADVDAEERLDAQRSHRTDRRLRQRQGILHDGRQHGGGLQDRIQQLSHPGRNRAEGSPFPPRAEVRLRG